MLDRTAAVSAAHEYTPTFVDRQNVTGSYGDNQQDFWMVLSQNDWSGGEQQRYVRVNDAESRRRYWRGSAVDISRDGEVQLGPSTVSLATAGTVIASCNWRGVPVFTVASNLYRADDNVVSLAGAFTSTLTGHGAYGLASDGTNVFIACATGGTDGAIRKWNGSAFSDFSVSLGTTSVEFANNVLYSVGTKSGSFAKLYSHATDGTPTTLFTWETADGLADGTTIGRIRKFAGTLLMHTLTQAGILYQYDGTSLSEIAQLPPAFLPTEIAVSEGIVFVGGAYLKRDIAGNGWYHKPAVFFYVDGRLDELWRADGYNTVSYSSATTTIPTANPVLYLNGVAWWDSVRGQLQYYDVQQGAVCGVSANTAVTGLGAFTGATFFNGPSTGVAGVFPDYANTASTGYVRTSLFDADSALPKYWKSVKVDADLPSGATIDIAYRLNDLDGSYTTLQSSATVGTEYTLAQSARSISIQVTLNKGSGGSPILKRIYVRGVPILDTFRRETYVLDLSGKDGKTPVRHRDDTDETLDGLELATNLRSSASSTSPFSVTDEFGTYTAIIEPGTFRLERVNDQEYRATLTTRQVG